MPAKIARRAADAVAFYDQNPQAPVHLLVIPLAHLGAVRDAKGPEGERLLGRLLAFAAETATDLGIPVGTVKSRAHYALLSLRQAIEDAGGG